MSDDSSRGSSIITPLAGEPNKKSRPVGRHGIEIKNERKKKREEVGKRDEQRPGGVCESRWRTDMTTIKISSLLTLVSTGYKWVKICLLLHIWKAKSSWCNCTGRIWKKRKTTKVRSIRWPFSYSLNQVLRQSFFFGELRVVQFYRYLIKVWDIR